MSIYSIYTIVFELAFSIHISVKNYIIRAIFFNQLNRTTSRQLFFIETHFHDFFFFFDNQKYVYIFALEHKVKARKMKI